MEHTTVAVIGGGPAGIAATIWLHKFGIATVLLEADDALGGLQRQSPYANDWLPGQQGLHGQEVAAKLDRHAHDLGCAIRTNARVAAIKNHYPSFAVHCADENILTCRFIVMATGTTPRKAGFTASDTVAIGPGLPLERIDVKGKSVAVLGGGDNAFDHAALILRRGAARIQIFTRKPPRVQPFLRNAVPADAVRIGPYHADPNAMTVEEEKFDVFSVQYGFEPVGIQGLDLAKNDQGYIAINNRGETSIKGIYACGDVTNFLQPCVATASALGIQAAQSISYALATLSAADM